MIAVWPKHATPYTKEGLGSGGGDKAKAPGKVISADCKGTGVGVGTVVRTLGDRSHAK